MTVVLAIGVSTNIEGFAKSVFNQESLNTFNKINTAWMVVYFILLQHLQSDLLGVFTGFLLFYAMRGVIATSLASRQCSPVFTWHELLRPLLPTAIESIGYVAGYLASREVMLRFADKELLGFGVCCVIGVCHVAAFVFYRKQDLVAFKQSVRD